MIFYKRVDFSMHSCPNAFLFNNVWWYRGYFSTFKGNVLLYMEKEI